MKSINLLGLGLSAGYILTFYSEFSFYGQASEPGVPLPSLVDMLLLFLVYSLMALLVFQLILQFRVRSTAALFISGAFYGWVLEGMVVDTVYQAMPFTISFTSLAWHAPLDVVLGLYLVPRWLAEDPPFKNALRFLGMGALWGIWLLWPWSELRQGTPPESFLTFGTAATLGLMLAYWILGKVSLDSIQIPRIILVPLAVLLLISYLFQGLSRYPFKALILPLLLGSCWWALQRNRKSEHRENILSEINAPFQPQNIALIMLLPTSACLTYSFFLNRGWMLPSNIILGLVSSLGGTLLLVLSLGKIFRCQESADPAEQKPA